MLVITAVKLLPEQIDELHIDCDSVDYSAILSANRANSDTFDGCKLDPAWAVAFRPAEDIIIPVNLCQLHFAALRLGVMEGVATDADFFEG
jgi:hypothetical protein